MLALNTTKGTMEGCGLTIWHVGRCGSSVLGKCLSQHSQLQWDNEVFNKWMPNNRGNKSIPDLPQEITAIKSHKLKKYQAIDVKLLSCQHPGIFGLSALELHALLSKHGFNYHILLERQNIVRRMISHCAAMSRNTYHIKSSSSSPKLEKFYMPLEAIRVGTATRNLLEWIEIISSETRLLKDCLLEQGNFLHLTYEHSIEQDPIIGYGEVCTLLNLTAEPSKILLQKTNPFPISDLLLNHKEVSNMLAGTKYEWMAA